MLTLGLQVISAALGAACCVLRCRVVFRNALSVYDCGVGYRRADSTTEEAGSGSYHQSLCTLSPGEERDWPLTAQPEYRCFFAASGFDGETILVGTVDACLEHEGMSYTFELQNGSSGRPELRVTITTPDGQGDMQGAVRTGGVFEPDGAPGSDTGDGEAVSYTHLTLPTILLV